MAKALFTNNASGALVAAIATTGATSLSLVGGQGALFPTITGSDYFYTTIVDVSNNIEIVKVTANVADTFTIVRAQDNTTAKTFAIGSKVELRPCAAVFTEKLAVTDAYSANKIINGNMAIDQRNAGASVALSSTPLFVTDRFSIRMDTGSGHTAQQVSDGPPGFSKSLKVTIGTGASPAAGALNDILYKIEGFDIADLKWGTADAKPLATGIFVKTTQTGQFSVGLVNGSFNRSYVTTYNIPTANVWTEVVLAPVTGDTTGTWAIDNTTGLGLVFDLGMGSTLQTGTLNAWQAGNYWAASGNTKIVATSGATFQITGVKAETGSVHTPFVPDDAAVSLARCQRYYARLNAAALYTAFGSGVAYSANSAQFYIKHPQTMRAAPTINASGIAANDGSAAYPITALGTVFAGYDSSTLQTTSGGGGMTAKSGVLLGANNSATAWVDLTAEL